MWVAMCIFFVCVCVKIQQVLIQLNSFFFFFFWKQDCIKFNQYTYNYGSKKKKEERRKEIERRKEKKALLKLNNSISINLHIIYTTHLQTVRIKVGGINLIPKTNSASFINIQNVTMSSARFEGGKKRNLGQVRQPKSIPACLVATTKRLQEHNHR